MERTVLDELYGPHVEELGRAVLVAIGDAIAAHPEEGCDEFYTVKVECDGQYAEVTVGVSNVTDHTVTVDTDTGEIVTPKDGP